MLALSVQSRGIELSSIHDDYREDFVTEVIESYEMYLNDVKLPVIPALYFYGEQEFIDNFVDTFAILRHSYMRKQFPEFDWDSATDSEREKVDERISEQYFSEESDLIADIEVVLDHYQLFHIHLDEAYGDNGIEIIIYHYQSPLQEVW